MRKRVCGSERSFCGMPASAARKHHAWWGVDETGLLLSILGKLGAVAALDSKRQRNADVFFTVSGLLEARGYRRDLQQVRARWKFLKAQFYKEKSRVSRSEGPPAASKMRYFKEMEELLGRRSPTATRVLGVDSLRDWSPRHVAKVPNAEAMFVEKTFDTVEEATVPRDTDDPEEDGYGDVPLPASKLLSGEAALGLKLQLPSPSTVDSSEEDREETHRLAVTHVCSQPCGSSSGEQVPHACRKLRGAPSSVLHQLQRMHREHQQLVREQTQQIVSMLDWHHQEQMEATEQQRQEDTAMMRRTCLDIVAEVLDFMCELERQFSEQLSQDEGKQKAGVSPLWENNASTDPRELSGTSPP
nr:PREDICTED: uncharacterized protein LOC102357844 [Latimeria chalumnae]|eukprot:XP_005989804.1 PREDICTED: uncharacterized protein LOC102357844 [Latimeria chalumnae]